MHRLASTRAGLHPRARPRALADSHAVSRIHTQARGFTPTCTTICCRLDLMLSLTNPRKLFLAVASGKSRWGAHHRRIRTAGSQPPPDRNGGEATTNEAARGETEATGGETEAAPAPD
eukprot:1193080-Prorocentrum_minimum.AAC.7